MKLGLMTIVLACTGLTMMPNDRAAPRDDARVFQLEDLSSQRAASGRAYLSFLDVSAMSCGLYELPAGAKDGQQPHSRDEIYYVVKGKAVFVTDGERTDVKAGSVIYVKRGADHRFESITEDLSLIVVFAPGPPEREQP